MSLVFVLNFGLIAWVLLHPTSMLVLLTPFLQLLKLQSTCNDHFFAIFSSAAQIPSNNNVWNQL